MTGTLRNSALSRNQPLRADPAKPLRRRGRIRPVSLKRQRENRVRAAMADRLWPGRREGTVMCAVWEAIQPDWCDRWASDLHEPLSRARGGSITDPGNCAPLCRSCHARITDEEPAWAYDLGLLVHSWEVA